MVPDKACFERSIPVMFPALLQEIPVKLQVGFEGSQEEKRFTLVV